MKILCLLTVLCTSIVLSTSTTPQLTNSDVIQALMTELQGKESSFLAAAEGPFPEESAQQVTMQSYTGGSVYTRWGNSDCPATAELVYSGIAAGHWYRYSGGGANYLCLPEEPQYYDEVRAGVQAYSRLYGAEYEQPLGGSDDHNPPCAVCFVSRSSSLMIPAKHTCPSHWTQEYNGYLMSERDSYSSSMYVCVDKELESLPDSERSTDGALLYNVEVDCGYGIPCLPYDETKELSCVVCTK